MRRSLTARAGVLALAAGCGASVEEPAPEGPAWAVERQALSCPVGCGGALGSAVLPGPSGAVTLTAWSNSPQLGTTNDCDPTACAGGTPNRAQNGQLSYGCPWQCVELVNRYLQGTWGGPKIAQNAGANFCAWAAMASVTQYYVYGAYGVSTSGNAPVAGDVLVWSSHVAIATNSMSPGASGTIDVIGENATCSGLDTVSWSGSMFGGKYGLAALCWIHVLANHGFTGPTCPPAGGNWHTAGLYCGDEPGMSNTAAQTLYSCASAGGAATVAQTCPYGCQHMMATVNDQCAQPVANGGACTASYQCLSGSCIASTCAGPDAGGAVDAGGGPDAGMGQDAGSSVDAGPGRDAGPSLDAGRELDAGGAGPAAPAPEASAAHGFGCAAAPGLASTGWLAAAALALTIARRARR